MVGAKLTGEVVSISMLKLMLELSQNWSQNESLLGPLVLLLAVYIGIVVAFCVVPYIDGGVVITGLGVVEITVVDLVVLI